GQHGDVVHIDAVGRIRQLAEEAVERRDLLLHPGMCKTIACDGVAGGEHTATVRIEPHFFREYVGAFGKIRMKPRRDRTDRREIGGMRTAPMRLAHLRCPVCSTAIYSATLP